VGSRRISLIKGEAEVWLELAQQNSIFPQQPEKKLQQNESSEEIFNLVERALTWLESNDYANPILKWNTGSWGEIPADFGRK
jgi:hypothetical protein